MHRTLRDSATLLRHHGLTRWSLLLLPALLLVLTAPLQPEGAGMEAVRFLGFGLALVPLARVISILVELVISITALGSGLYSLVVVSVAGAVITNCLLVLGVSTIWAGRRQKSASEKASNRWRAPTPSIALPSIP
jgi:Ca2+:H+ antiporter